MQQPARQAAFELIETTIDAIRRAYDAKEISARELVQGYLDRIDAFDRNGPTINSIISVNPAALDEADRLDATFAASGPVGPLHGVPVVLKDQIDAKGMPTTLGSVLFRNYFPDRDAFIVERLKSAGAIILAKATLGELGGGDTHGSLFGSTKNPYALDRTVGGSSGGPAAAIAANLGVVGVGQEAFASIRRPSAWNSIVGMRPTAGLVSRSGVYAGWPAIQASLGPMTRGVRDAALLLDVLAAYDTDDPVTAMGVGRTGRPFAEAPDADALRGARIGVLREAMGAGAEPDSEDFGKVTGVFDQAARELAAAGATVVDPVEIPGLNRLLAKRAAGAEADAAWDLYFGRSTDPPFRTRAEMVASPDFEKVRNQWMARAGTARDMSGYYEYLVAREELMVNVMRVMADLRLDAIVHKSAEHQPTLIKDGVNPPYVNMKGATHLNTFLVYVPSISVPMGFTTDGLPAGMTFLGRPYSDAAMIGFAYAYEQAAPHRRPPASAPAL